MWPNTKINSLLNISLPLIQAPMAGGATTPELISAVANAGGLGSLGAGYMRPIEIRDTIHKIRELTNKPFAVSLFIPERHQATSVQIERAKKAIEDSCVELNWHPSIITPPYAQSFDEQMQIIIEEKISIVSFAFGVLDQGWIEKCKNAKIKLIGTATTLAEAKLLAESNIDIIVAQGSEGGGHRSTFLTRAEDALIPLATLIPLLKAEIKIPIIAAGGIMDGQTMVSMLELGASGVQMGTIFLTCKESGIHPSVKKLLLNQTNDTTTLTRAFSGKLARGINNKFIERMQQHTSDILDYPIQNALTVPMRKEAAKQNCTDFMSMWAGQKAYLCQDLGVSELVEKLNQEAIHYYENSKARK